MNDLFLAACEAMRPDQLEDLLRISNQTGRPLEELVAEAIAIYLSDQSSDT